MRVCMLFVYLRCVSSYNSYKKETRHSTKHESNICPWLHAMLCEFMLFVHAICIAWLCTEFSYYCHQRSLIHATPPKWTVHNYKFPYIDVNFAVSLNRFLWLCVLVPFVYAHCAHTTTDLYAHIGEVGACPHTLDETRYR